VVFVPFIGGKPSGPPVDVLTGFPQADEKAQGRPVGVALDKGGALLVADDVGNAVWRVARSQGQLRTSRTAVRAGVPTTARHQLRRRPRDPALAGVAAQVVEQQRDGLPRHLFQVQVDGGERRHAGARAQAVVARDDHHVVGNAAARCQHGRHRAARKGVHRHAEGVDAGVRRQQRQRGVAPAVFALRLVDQRQQRCLAVRLGEREVGRAAFQVGVALAPSRGSSRPARALCMQVVEQQARRPARMDVDVRRHRRAVRRFPSAGLPMATTGRPRRSR
jgi:hypothetical protein